MVVRIWIAAPIRLRRALEYILGAI